MPQKTLSLPIGRHLHDSNTPLGVGTERRRNKDLFFFHKKGALAFFGQRALGNSHSFLVLPLCGESDHHDLIFGGLAFFEKESLKSYAKGLWGGFFCRFEVYRTAINRIIITHTIRIKNTHYILASKNTARAFLPIFLPCKTFTGQQ